MSDLEHVVTERGFVHMQPVRGTSNGEVRVYESSAAYSYWPERGDDGKVTQGEAAGPFIWLAVTQQDDASGAIDESHAHLTIEAATTLRDQLSWLIEQAK